MSETHIKRIVYNTLCGLAYMHILNVMHRDIKPANVLVNQDCSVKICDFGLSRCLPQGFDSLNVKWRSKYDV